MASINQSVISENDVVRPTNVEVNLDRIRRNLKAIREQVFPSKVMAILKANAYGHGLVRIAQFVESEKVDCLGVAVLEEGILLREAGIQSPILVLGGILGNQIPHFLKYDLQITASSVEKLEQIEQAASQTGKKAQVHLKIDTGMERIGIHYYNADKLLDASLRCKHIHVAGIFSHFANADSSQLEHSRLQLTRFQEVLKFYDDRSVPVPLRHMANSPAILQMPESYFDMVRPGLILYGVYPTLDIPRTVILEPALAWKSHVVYFKVIKPGHPVGYGSSWESSEMVRAVTVPVGYGDGYFRSMTDSAEVIIRGQRFPVIGTISMDQIVVNIGWKSAYNNDDVILIGESNGQSVTCTDLSEWAGTIPYEILTNINTRVPRVYIDQHS